MAMPRRPRSSIRLAVLTLAIALCAVPAHAKGVVLPLPPDDHQVITAKASRRSMGSGSSAVRMCPPARMAMVR